MSRGKMLIDNPIQFCAWTFENILITLGSFVFIALLLTAGDIHRCLLYIENFIDHVVRRENALELIHKIHWVIFAAFVAICIVRATALLRALRRY